MADHSITHVPGAMHDDPPGEDIAVARIKALETDRVTMGACIGVLSFSVQ
jgi:hypothetical protein